MVAVWLSAWQRAGIGQRSYSTSGPVSAWMGDRLGRVNHLGAEPAIHVNSAWPSLRG